MAAGEHPLERRANALAEALTRRVDLLATMMRPNDRPIFHERLSEPKAMEFWQKHRYDDLGQNVMSTWTPDQILALDQRLMQARESGQEGAAPPWQTAPVPSDQAAA